MTAPCFYHPDKIAANQCAQCGVPICAECTDRVGEKTVCVKCVQAVRTRLEQQMAAAPASAYGTPPSSQPYQASGYNAGPSLSGSQSFGGSNYTAPTAVPTPAQWAVGIILGLVIAIAGAAAISKFEAGSPLSLSLLYVFVGYGVAWGLLKGTRCGGTTVASAAVAVYLLGVAAGLLTEAESVLSGLRNTDSPYANASVGQFLPVVVGHEGFVHWIFVAFGAYGCFRYVMRRS